MMNASRAILIDTNLLVYRADPRDRVKQARAGAVLNRLVASDRGVLSVQCLSEFFRVATRRLPDPLSLTEARLEVERLIRTFVVFDVTPAIVIEACRGAGDHGMSIWDALIWSCARLNQVPYVLTEDGEHGRVIEAVQFLNPFDATFDPALI